MIEIASVDVLKDGTIANRLEQLVCPTIPVPPEASAVQPPLKEVLPLFQGAHAYVAHNADFEQAFLGKHLGEAVWVCTFKCALRIWPDFPVHSNQALRYRLGFANPLSTGASGSMPCRSTTCSGSWRGETSCVRR